MAAKEPSETGAPRNNGNGTPGGPRGAKPVTHPQPAGEPLGADAVETGELQEEQLRKVKTGLNRRDLERYRQLLLEKRAEILGDVASLQIDRRNTNAGGNLSNMPLHMADVGTDNYEQEFTLGLVESERRLLREIDDSLTRMDRGYYGVCLERGVPISKARLEAKPWAKYCIEVERERERTGSRRR